MYLDTRLFRYFCLITSTQKQTRHNKSTLKWQKCVTIKTSTHTHTHILSQPAMRDSFKGNWFYPRLISPSLSLELHQQSVNRLAGQASFVSAKETPQSDHHHSHTHTQHPCGNPAAQFKYSETPKCCHIHTNTRYRLIRITVHTQAHTYKCTYTHNAGE